MNEFEEAQYEKYLSQWETEFSSRRKIDKRIKDFQNFEIKVPKINPNVDYYTNEYENLLKEVNDDKRISNRTDAEVFIEKAEDLVENIHNALQDLLEFLYDKYKV